MPPDADQVAPKSPDAAPRRLNPIARRIVYMLALLPIVPGMSAIGCTVSETPFIEGVGFDGDRVFHLWSAMLWTTGTILVWRQFVLWTFGKKALTTLVAAVPFAQVIYPHPLWNAGCISSGFLRNSQHLSGLGLWVWLTIWIWWGWEKFAMNVKSTGDSERPASQAIHTPYLPTRRLIASIGLIPFVVGVFGVVCIAAEKLLKLTMNSGWDLAIPYSAAALVAVGTWFAIWRGAGRAGGGRNLNGLTSAVGMIGFPIVLMALLLSPNTSGSVYVTLIWLPVIGWGLWIAYTATIWQIGTTAEDETKVTPKCVRCGYLLTGLRATRCPECGDEPTLDELWRATSGNVG